MGNKDVTIYNEYYKTFTAEYVNTNKFPKIDFDKKWYNADSLAKGTIVLSKSRCKTLKVQVIEREQPIAFKRVHNGFVALYNRTGRVELDKLFHNEVIL